MIKLTLMIFFVTNVYSVDSLKQQMNRDGQFPRSRNPINSSLEQMKHQMEYNTYQGFKNSNKLEKQEPFYEERPYCQNYASEDCTEKSKLYSYFLKFECSKKLRKPLKNQSFKWSKNNNRFLDLRTNNSGIGLITSTSPLDHILIEYRSKKIKVTISPKKLNILIPEKSCL